MRKFSVGILLFFGLLAELPAQDIVHRAIFIGDAGELNTAQETLIPNAARHVLKEKTTVFFLGDNIYPHGMPLPESGERKNSEAILRSQFKPFREQGAPVFFVPGNHDWDRSGKKGLQKIIEQGHFLKAQNDSLLKMLPADGCPGPEAVELAHGLVAIMYDSEWWLFPFDKTNESADCDCKTEAAMIARLKDLLHQYRGQTVLLISHHPLASYGTHGGRFSLKDHIFPLTVVNKNLYMPLPVVGSLYPLLRSVLTNPEDLKHPLYKNLIREVEGASASVSNIAAVAGHEHGLQFIENKGTLPQIVSGGGAKKNYTIKGPHSLFGQAVQGYVIADWLSDRSVRYTFWEYYKNGVKEVFSHQIPFRIPPQYVDKISWPPQGADSVTVSLRPAFDSVGRLHRKIFGENYRREFATPTRLPVLRLSSIKGGLTVEKKGGGMQTISLRLVDQQGKEWVLRSLEKNPDPLLPSALRRTFARDVLDDYMSAQHPFSPLVVPTLARASGVPHAHPEIGVVAPDSLAMGDFEPLFAGKAALLEEREPLGSSDNSPKMIEKLIEDNDNKVDGKVFLKARMLDLLLGDWDRHPDQWRWYDSLDGKGKYYLSVPRDRDQALYRREGLLPNIASRPYILPTLQGFSATIEKPKYALQKSGFLNGYLSARLSHQQWTALASEFVTNISDAVIDSAFAKLPQSAYDLRGKELASIMKKRRDKLPEAMESYYRFSHKIVDLVLSDKNEKVTISDAAKGALLINIRKINKDGELKDELLNERFDPAITREIRLYLHDGKDEVTVQAKQSKIKLRIIGGSDKKLYIVEAARRPILLYDQKNGSGFTGQQQKLKQHISNDSLNTAYVQANPYHFRQPLITGGYNLDDGLILGAGMKFTRQGFRKAPASIHEFTVAHSFSTEAYRIKYQSEWLHAFRHTDIILKGLAKAPNNTQNFFGLGNETGFDKSGNYKRYYRTRFAVYDLGLSFRWRGNKKSAFSFGPSFEYYHYDADDNAGRFINNTALIGTYDSSIIAKDKLHSGIRATWVNDNRNHTIIPSWGTYLQVGAKLQSGLNSFSKNYGQLGAAFSFYKNLNPSETIVLANRIGGSLLLGDFTFYQANFLGGHENLLGYRQYRFAGRHIAYNNTELRIKLADLANYILPGQLGITGFFDVGRVWTKSDLSDKWHNGYGGGIYLAPAGMVLFQGLLGISAEGVYPYFTFGFRF
ncbi:BamA/TamA family outer membrane protein [Niabella insulamsoli]|uniref:BamA/TamA family outer membrane protein n=1 Tax=Niabella insulamsoli TaxID=3144874 RepID=UPI0031FC1B98